jgi:flagellar protein FliT
VAAASEAIACHRELAGVVARMLALARSSQWKRLPALDAECAAMAARLRTMELTYPTDEDKAALATLLSGIADDQAALTELVRPQFVALMNRIGEQHRPHARMRGRKPTHDPEKCPPGGARSSTGNHAH